MALLGILQLVVGHFELPARSVLGDGFSEELSKWGRGSHMTVNVDDFLTVMHKRLLIVFSWSLRLFLGFKSNVIHEDVISSVARDPSPIRWPCSEKRFLTAFEMTSRDRNNIPAVICHPECNEG